jgi:hypothetical protein
VTAAEPETGDNEAGGAIVSDDVLDAIVRTAADDEWRKVAVFIARTVDMAKAADVTVSGQQVAARVYALVETGTLEARGNVRRWRAGEVRRATPTTPTEG